MLPSPIPIPAKLKITQPLPPLKLEMAMATAKPPPYLEEIPIGACYKLKEYPQRAKGLSSFFAFICSIFVYISVFYIFNLSPSAFLYNNKFWFFISNTLILIIAADYGAFSSSDRRNKHDLYEEYVRHSQARSVPSFVSQYHQISQKSNFPKGQAEDRYLPEIRKSVIYPQREKDPENNTQEIVITNCREPENPKDNFQDKRMDVQSSMKGDNEEAGDERKLIQSKNYRRSKSDRHRPKRVVIDESKNINIIRRSESKRLEPPAFEEENEFSAMSTEELNRRVEEFIQKFNRQIRLQRARKFHEI